MSTDLQAVYEGGAFWPLKDQHVALPEGEVVKLTVQSTSNSPASNVLALAAKVYEGLSGQDIAEIERIAFDRTHFFDHKVSQ